MVIKKVSEFGTIKYVNEQGQYHREDGPAIEYANGEKYWYFNNKLHRIGGPAEEYPGGSKVWRKNNKRHRLNAPAVIHISGYKEFWEFGIFIKQKY